MFGSKKLQDLEARFNSLQAELNQANAEKEELARQLEEANRQNAEMKARLEDFDLEKLKEEARSSRAEYEGLKDLYKKKNQDFDDAREDQEQEFAREQAIKRHNLENEIRDNRQANQDYVTDTVRTFGESYNYYLNQIKLLMDALGDVATRTGAALFSGENADLKARFGSQMRKTLKSGMDALETDTGDCLLFDAEEESAPVAEAAAGEDPAEKVPVWTIPTDDAEEGAPLENE